MIPYSKQIIDKDDIKAVTKVLKSNFLTQGPMVEKFEKKIKKLVGAKYAIALNSATSGLHLSCLSLNEVLIKREVLDSLVKDFERYGLPHIYLNTIIFYSLKKSEVINKINNALGSEEDGVLRDTFKAIFYCIKQDGSLCGDLLNNVFQYVKYTKTDNLHYGLEVIKELVKTENINLDQMKLGLSIMEILMQMEL